LAPSFAASRLAIRGGGQSALIAQTSRFLRRQRPRFALSTIAFRTAQTFDDIIQPSVPPRKGGEGAWIAAAGVAARALQENDVLTEFVGQPVYFQIAHS